MVQRAEHEQRRGGDISASRLLASLFCSKQQIEGVCSLATTSFGSNVRPELGQMAFLCRAMYYRSHRSHLKRCEIISADPWKKKKKKKRSEWVGVGPRGTPNTAAASLCPELECDKCSWWKKGRPYSRLDTVLYAQLAQNAQPSQALHANLSRGKTERGAGG